MAQRTARRAILVWHIVANGPACQYKDTRNHFGGHQKHTLSLAGRPRSVASELKPTLRLERPMELIQLWRGLLLPATFMRVTNLIKMLGF